MKKDNLPICKICEDEMIDGFVYYDNYYCSETCIRKEVSPQEYNDAYKNDEDEVYWTTFAY